MLNQTDLTRADLNLLLLFEVVLEERHVGRAAQRLRLTPSAVSHGLGRLRRLLNDPLFLRTPRGVVPTARAMELALPVAEAFGVHALGIVLIELRWAGLAASVLERDMHLDIAEQRLGKIMAALREAAQ